MAVPEEIRKVRRPVNTIVEDSGSSGMLRYAVRSRNGASYHGGNPLPRNGSVIGHIINGEYVPIGKKTAEKGPDMLSYGPAALFRSVSGDILEDLLKVYPAKDAYGIISMACLRVIRPGISCLRLKTHYDRTFTSVFYPGCALSKNSVCSLLNRVGQDGGKRKDFYSLRMAAAMKDHHIAIDGTLKQDSSTVNDLSKFSYKARVKGCKDISVIYAYDIEKMEPLCAEVFPGNSIDASSYREFIRDNGIKKGLIIDDKGFPVNMIRKELESCPDLHYLTPIRRNDRRIADNNALAFDGVLKGIGKDVLYSKRRIKKDGTWLYAFRDVSTASKEEHGFVRNSAAEDFDAEKYLRKRDSFGTVVFESDEDMDPAVAYGSYSDRWLLELVFDRYKNDECLDSTRVQDDFSLIGSEFVNFIATAVTCRILNKARDAKVLEDMTYGDMMEDLSEAWRKADAPEDPSSDDGDWIHALPESLRILEALGLSKPAPVPPKRKRGRPRKHPAGQ